ncbi:NADPH:quinone oxidoreductase family protein [Crossiella sp. CA-258035]|uniref:quinone oxidoreductase family protein n=1 Tax=Crossiella sp. CA-258035 TaxID=2981138 RepID=UPI0024BD3316|nr:NADPH:quinone oxidoreductase family protein [Crossiella sp. CA-258035]WHT22114.1 NADPH:quinone oxidoreductase family protein [Crossiella sp. CA-258035]
MRAVQITEFGGPEVMALAELPDPVAAEGQVLVEVDRAGVNYGDTHNVENSYLAPAKLPLIPGGEVIGRTAEGRRVIALIDSGGYASKVVAAPERLFAVPEDISHGDALALICQGTTAWHILRTSARIQPGESVVVHAAAGGVGSLAVQLAKVFGAGTVIATASTEDKRKLALDLGADAAVDGDPDGLAERLREANGGKRIDVVLEMVGGPVFDASLSVLAPFGRIVAYGSAGRVQPTPVLPAKLMRGSLSIVGFWLIDCLRNPAELVQAPFDEMVELVREGKLRPQIGGEYPMSAARTAHEDLRARRTVGKLVLDPAQ